MSERLTTRDLARIPLFTALILVCTRLSIPLPGGVPVTLQTFALALAGFCLGPLRGCLAVLVYLLLGAVGLPVFSGFTGGVGCFAGPTGGFLWGFPLLAAGCGLLRGRSFPLRLAVSLPGLLLCHLLGALWYARFSGLAVLPALGAVSLPFLPKDLVSLALALALSRPLARRGALK